MTDNLRDLLRFTDEQKQELRRRMMTDTLRDRIAAVHQAHRWGVFRCDDGYARTCCRCQWREIADGPTHAEHVADAVIRELGLRRERDLAPDKNWKAQWQTRYVTDWTADE